MTIPPKAVQLNPMVEKALLSIERVGRLQLNDTVFVKHYPPYNSIYGNTYIVSKIDKDHIYLSLYQKDSFDDPANEYGEYVLEKATAKIKEDLRGYSPVLLESKEIALDLDDKWAFVTGVRKACLNIDYEQALQIQDLLDYSMPNKNLIGVLQADFQSLIVYATRYTIGRQSYAPNEMKHIIQTYLPLLPTSVLHILVNDIDFEGKLKGLGAECDEIMWKSLQAYLKAEIEKRGD